jgi:hypothetical protein
LILSAAVAGIIVPTNAPMQYAANNCKRIFVTYWLREEMRASLKSHF